MPGRKIIVLLPERVKNLLEERLKKQERSEITAQIIRYIKLGEFIYQALDREETICLKKPDGTIEPILFIDP